ncbi:cytokine receptor common subunit gamma-like [Salarias fasciatus]|uniref:Cytokine receptor common subunit gamma-like n=1 Tax=Salarias fasciatus TaxID=181472 RepID=A0A672FGT4_SALFA|nr:cytokine receptor common subunit gamma-like [Salarias fasciatus]
MTMRALLFFCLFGYTFGEITPNVSCVIIDVRYVSCTWNQQGTPEVNYTFNSWFHYENKKACTNYLSEKNVKTGCIRPYAETQRFRTFHTQLVHGSNSFTKDHNLKNEVLLNPPANLTVLFGEDKNLWFYWNYTVATNCVRSEVRHRINNKNWQSDVLGEQAQKYCINLPSSTHHYELQVRSKMADACGASRNWGNWSEPVEWGSNNSTDPHPKLESENVWTPVFYVMFPLIFVILVSLLLYHERLRIIPVVPKPTLIIHDIEDWLQSSKSLKESFKANYNELPCPVREYCHVSQSDSESSSSSTSSLTTDQTDCSVCIPVNEP